MKKQVLMFVVCLLSIIATNTVQAQTKEETIQWLKGKLTNHFKDFSPTRGCKIGCSFTLESVEVNECEITYKCKFWWGFSGGTTEWYTYVIPTRDLTISNGQFYLNYDGIKIIQTASTYKSKTGQSLEKPAFTHDLEGYFGINVSGEVDLQSRVEKAITHLVTFCPEKPKEAF